MYLGQIAVAVGRVKQKKGLTVTNFRSSLCFKQLQQTLLYTDSPSCEAIHDFTCCKNKETLTAFEALCFQDDEDDDDFSDVQDLHFYVEREYGQQTRDIDSESTVHIHTVGHCPFDTMEMLRKLRYPGPKTPKQRDINILINALEPQDS